MASKRERPHSVSDEEWVRIQEALDKPIEQRAKPSIRKVDPSALPSMGFKPVTRQTKRVGTSDHEESSQ